MKRDGPRQSGRSGGRPDDQSRDADAAREASPRALSWQDIPLEVLMCAAAIFLAAGLKLAGFMP